MLFGPPNGKYDRWSGIKSIFRSVGFDKGTSVVICNGDEDKAIKGIISENKSQLVTLPESMSVENVIV